MAKKRIDPSSLIDDNQEATSLNTATESPDKQVSYIEQIENNSISELKAKGLLVSEMDVSELSVSPLNTRIDDFLTTHNEEFSSFVEDIREQGQLQAAIGRLLPDGKVEVLAGKNRLQACRIIGRKLLIVILKNINDKAAVRIMFAENMKRQELSQYEISLQLKAFKDSGASTNELKNMTNAKSDAAITKRLAFSEIDKDLLAIFPDIRAIALEDGYNLTSAFHNYFKKNDKSKNEVINDLNTFVTPKAKANNIIKKMIDYLKGNDKPKPRERAKKVSLIDKRGNSMTVIKSKTGEIKIKSDGVDVDSLFSRISSFLENNDS